MMTVNFLESLREVHQDCCLTDNCADENCHVDISDIVQESLVIIHGETHRDRHGDRNTKMADRLIFADYQGVALSGLVAAVVELKGGMSFPLSDTVEQIRMGMQAIERILDEKEVAAWYPVLMFSGTGPRRPQYVRNLQLQRNRIEFRKDTPKTIFLKDCGSKLTEILDELANRYSTGTIST